MEHHSVLHVADHFKENGYDVSFLSVNEKGVIDLDELRKTLRDDTALVSIMWANNETGVVSPIEKIGPIIKERGVLFHVDGVQAAGKIPMEWLVTNHYPIPEKSRVSITKMTNPIQSVEQAVDTKV